MEDLNKISYMQFYDLVSNLVVDLFLIVLCMSISKLTPPLVFPIITLAISAYLYMRLYIRRGSDQGGCHITEYAIYLCLVLFSFASIIINLLALWGVIILDDELLFLNRPFIPSLLMMPVCFVAVLYVKLRGKSLGMCVRCRLDKGSSWERGHLGSIVRNESRVQINNLLFVFGFTGVVVWVYYLRFYFRMNQNDRDWFVFTWLTVIIFILDIVYFIARYYNLYLDLKECGEIAEPGDVDFDHAKTYMRFYVICGEKIWVNPQAVPLSEPDRVCTDTPFVTKRMADSVTEDQALEYIKKATGVHNGDLRFYYGRKLEDFPNRSLLRYFYFLDGKPEDYAPLTENGVWTDFKNVKNKYITNPGSMARFYLVDLSRLASIMVTSKTYHENGKRRSRLKSYRPSFNLQDVRNSNINFQDDKWIKVSMFNADKPFFGLRRFFRKLFRIHARSSVNA